MMRWLLMTAVVALPLDAFGGYPNSVLWPIAEAYNKNLPVLMDRNTRFANVQVLDGELVYYYDLLDMDAGSGSISKEKFDQLSLMLTPEIRTQYCSNHEVVSLLNEYPGLRLQFRFRDRRLVYLALVRIDALICAEHLIRG